MNTAAIASYESNSFYTDKDVYALANISELFYQQHEDNKDVYDAICEAEQNLKDAAEERETQGVWKTVAGVGLLVVGGVCIVASWGAATPVVAAAEGIVGTGTTIFGVADSAEGAQDIYYGSIGDIDSTAVNDLKDVVFQGNEEAYYLTESVFAFAASAMIPIGQAASAGKLTFRSGATIVAKEGIATAAGAGAQKYTTDLTGNQAAGMIAGMAASMATAQGLNGIEAGAKRLAKPKHGDGLPNKDFLKNISKDCLYDGEIKEISTTAKQKAYEAGLSDEEIFVLRKIKQGQKPNPERYLSEDFMREKLGKFEKDGCYKIISDAWGEPSDTIGRDGLYVINGEDFEALMLKADGNPRIIEQELAMDSGYLGDNPYIIKIEEPQNLRIPTGNEPNAWQDEWCPAATTRNGVCEAVIDPPTREQYQFRQLIGDMTWK